VGRGNVGLVGFVGRGAGVGQGVGVGRGVVGILVVAGSAASPTMTLERSNPLSPPARAHAATSTTSSNASLCAIAHATRRRPEGDPKATTALRRCHRSPLLQSLTCLPSLQLSLPTPVVPAYKPRARESASPRLFLEHAKVWARPGATRAAPLGSASKGDGGKKLSSIVRLCDVNGVGGSLQLFNQKNQVRETLRS
jgi:hypothetical protein